MLYSIIAISILCIILMVRNYKNRFSWLLVIKLIGLNIAIFGLVTYINKVTIYYNPSTLFFILDYKIYSSLSQIGMNLYLTSRLMNIGIAIFLLMVPIFTYLYNRNGQGYSSHSVNFKLLILLMLPVCYAIFYDPLTSYHFYLKISENDNQSSVDFVKKLISTIDLINYLWILTYLFYPFVTLYLKLRTTVVNIKRQQIYFLSFFFLILNSFFTLIFIIGPFREVYYFSNDLPRELLKLTPISKIPAYYFSLLPVLMIVSFFAMLLVLLRFRSLDTPDFFKIPIINKKVKLLNNNIRNVLHSHKNMLFSIMVLSKQVHEEYIAHGESNSLKKISQISESGIDKITKVLKIINEIKIRPAKYKLEDCIEAALSKVVVPKMITIRKEYLETIYVYVDFLSFTDCLINVIQNAIEAIEETKQGSGEIVLTLVAENEWAIIRILDNGVGIDKKKLKQIFQPLYTSKTRKINWGIGLSYVSKVIKAHLGQISITSKLGDYTRVEILLPIDTGRRGK
jgi:signal transduction histidine kinase